MIDIAISNIRCMQSTLTRLGPLQAAKKVMCGLVGADVSGRQTRPTKITETSKELPSGCRPHQPKASAIFFLEIWHG